MLKRILQAAIITFLLNLLASISSPTTTQSAAVFPSQVAPKLLLSLREVSR